MRNATKGAVMLKAWRKQDLDITQSAAAALVGVHQTTFSEWEAGKEPQLRHALRLQKVAKIPVTAWGEPAEPESGSNVNAPIARAS